jgi:hypothetical protein
MDILASFFQPVSSFVSFGFFFLTSTIYYPKIISLKLFLDERAVTEAGFSFSVG